MLQHTSMLRGIDRVRGESMKTEEAWLKLGYKYRYGGLKDNQKALEYYQRMQHWGVQLQ